MIIWATALPVPIPPQEAEQRIQLLLEDDQLLKHSSGRRPHFQGTLVQPGLFLLIPKRWLLIKNPIVVRSDETTTLLDIRAQIDWQPKYVIGFAILLILLFFAMNKDVVNLVVLGLISCSTLWIAAVGSTYMIKNILADALKK